MGELQDEARRLLDRWTGIYTSGTVLDGITPTGVTKDEAIDEANHVIESLAAVLVAAEAEQRRLSEVAVAARAFMAEVLSWDDPELGLSRPESMRRLSDALAALGSVSAVPTGECVFDGGDIGPVRCALPAGHGGDHEWLRSRDGWPITIAAVPTDEQPVEEASPDFAATHDSAGVPWAAIDTACPRCGGAGVKQGQDICVRCNGSGWVTAVEAPQRGGATHE